MGEEHAMSWRAVFIVRLDRDDAGRISGSIERVRTGEKVWVDALESVGRVLAAMLAGDVPEPSG